MAASNLPNLGHSSPRPWPFFLPSYAVLLREFRNGLKLAWAHHRRRQVDRARFWDGQVVSNVSGREGFVDTLVEIWGLNGYTVDGFYLPAGGDVVLDVGANVGLFSVWLARRAAGIRVWAFEPFRENYEALADNLSGWDHRVTPLNVALGRAEGSGHMLVTGNRSLDHRLATGQLAGVPVIRVISLADAVALTGADVVDFLKLDVEGAELDIFEGADAATLRRIRKMAIEYHDNIRPGTLAGLQELLRATHRVVSVRGNDYGTLQAELIR
jgi:FkbM family methyltransferase